MLPRAFAFDIFGTVVDWRSGIARDSATHLAAIDRHDVDPYRFADAWRGRYVPAMAEVREGRRAWVVLDILHREMLDATLVAHGIDPAGVCEDRLADWTRAWHRLDPWPDSVAGLDRLRALAPVVTLSNGNVALIVAMARRAGLRWDAICGAELARAYKPDPQAYLGTAAALAIAPAALCLVAAHHSDLAAARSCGLATAFIHRPDEYGGAPAPDAAAAQTWDWHATGLDDLATQMEAAAPLD